MVSTSLLKDLQKTEKWPFQTLTTFVFELKVASKPFSNKLPMTKFRFKTFERFALLSRKIVSTASLKNLQKTEKCSFQTLRTLHSFLSSRLLQNHFLRRFLWPNFDLDSFESFVSLYQKTVSTLLLKNLQKIKKWHFQMFTTFAFDLIGFFPHLPHMVAEKFAKTWKMRFWNALETE